MIKTCKVFDEGLGLKDYSVLFFVPGLTGFQSKKHNLYSKNDDDSALMLRCFSFFSAAKDSRRDLEVDMRDWLKGEEFFMATLHVVMQEPTIWTSNHKHI